ncbi:MAG TPA: carboxymuconolactone decarboxylase family protein [Acidiphilium sp.]|uniref:carboxymuconolactone decarboxylase family protein n=1 Tax=unclassified Acidiphilium TaxID=2617493 RepID=UPI000BD15135|nr:MULTISPECIES: carboxymuconolactone decarboxylase family protein [unclassified Acidiphilium]OYV56114.1 MAG: alkylhydroperoxidase [Acidiphilium sp. 20-67-58]OYV86554.1 MAG: alkylhydroperoxidase [Acidiphilium sp. 21-68-69]HQT62698.1 carboxymuconolactone decarboxylase family protein [Acidiphilium sp.]HQU12402.1 carboxymuconolactone decarboxylase family protein [Acidiphilium sp.]
MTADARLNLPALTLETASPTARAVLEKAKAQVGFIPNMYANMANSPGFLDTYLDGYVRFRTDSGMTPVEQEVVFLVISRANGCGYCTAAHSMIADKMSQVPADVLAALREGRTIADAKLAELAHFTQVIFDTRGRPTQQDLERFRAAGYVDRHALEIVLAMAVKTLSNYANHLFHTEVDSMFSGYKLPAAA